MTIYNRRTDDIPSGAIYIGRGSKWGNRYSHIRSDLAVERVKTREEAVEKHFLWLKKQLKEGKISLEVMASLDGKDLVCFCRPLKCHGETLEKLAKWAKSELDKQRSVSVKHTFTWRRHGGYECSTAGDARFSAFNCKLKDGRTIEMHYQCDVKGYDPNGVNWKLGKGKPPKNGMSKTAMYMAYKNLWREWCLSNYELFKELGKIAYTKHSGVLSDRFATTPINQACALSELLEEYFVSNGICSFSACI